MFMTPNFYAAPESLRRVQPNKAIVDNSEISWDIPTDLLVTGLELRVEANIVVTAIAGATHVAKADNPSELVKTMELQVGALKKKVTGRAAYYKHVLRTGRAPYTDPITSAEIAAGAGTYTVAIALPLHLSSLGCAPEELGTLAIAKGDTARLTVNIGTADDLWYGGAGCSVTATLNGTAYLARKALLAKAERRMDWFAEQYNRFTPVVGDQDSFLTPYRVHRGVLLLTEVPATTPAGYYLPSDVVVSNADFRLDSGLSLVDLTWAQMLDRMMSLHSWPSAAPTAGVRYVEFGKKHPTTNALWAASLQGRRASEIKAVLTALTATARVEVHQEYAEPVR